MKFIYIFSVLAATVSQALPTEGQAVELVNERVDAMEPILLEKRGPSAFNVYTSWDCTSGGTGIALSGLSKENFATGQLSVKVLEMPSSYHLTLYTQHNQGGDKFRLDSSNIGDCWFRQDGNHWWSYGVYDH
ncbi:hypothetical protein F4678DRAFT_464957 [Xylaria arbuscula]|nr:hypothetical protein F4678DRAFT_464957 [Xylaria arbuscula]